MRKSILLRTPLMIAIVLSACIPYPLHASARSDIKELKEELEILKQDQKEMKEQLAEIKMLVEQGARPTAAPTTAPFQPKDLVVGDSPVLGNADAAVTIFTYSDYQCPYCSRHASAVLPRLIKEYVDSGMLRIVMREYPIEAIHPRAFAAAQAAQCAGRQGQYWGMHELIFRNQKTLTDESFRQHAQSLELNMTAYDECLTDEAVKEEIEAEIQEAYSLGISGTPSFAAGLTDPEDTQMVHVTETIRGAQPFDRFKGVIESLTVVKPESESESESE